MRGDLEEKVGEISLDKRLSEKRPERQQTKEKTGPAIRRR